ncbi:MAG: hypothetical protein LBE67_12645 [Kocuria palustris]|jgi:26S proteasome regulatory subunit N9|nr:hypothetical protein [Kocuria palustris]
MSIRLRWIQANHLPLDDQERLAFLTSLASKTDTPDTQDAYVYALADVANVKLSLKDLDGAQTDLATCQRVLDTFDSVETVVHASFYKVNADYYHVRDLEHPVPSRV